MNCAWCGEPIQPGELSNLRPAHVECVVRMIHGSAAHIECRCGCFVPGSAESDPPGVDKREAARAAFAAFQIVRRRAARAGRN